MTRRSRFQPFGSMLSFSKDFCVTLVKVYYFPHKSLLYFPVFAVTFFLGKKAHTKSKLVFTPFRNGSQIEHEHILRGYHGIWPPFNHHSLIVVYGKSVFLVYVCMVL